MVSASYQPRFCNPDLEPALDDPKHPLWRRQRHPRLPKRTKLVVDLLREAPYSAAGSHRLQWDLSGLRAADLVGPWRLIFKVCEECRKENLQERNPLDCCRGEISLPNNTINLLYIDNYH